MLKEGMRYLCCKHLYREETLHFLKNQFQIVAKKVHFKVYLIKKNLGYLNPKRDESTYQMTLYHYKSETVIYLIFGFYIIQTAISSIMQIVFQCEIWRLVCLT